MPKNFKVTLDKVPQLTKSLKALAETRVMVGVPGDKAGRKGDEGPINNAALMKIHEDGAPEVNIPARPVVGPTIKENTGTITHGLKLAGDKALDGDINGMMKMFNALGITIQNKMRAKITDGLAPPLAERTLAGRRARGRSGEKPLLDTGQLRRALTYVLRKVRWAGKLLTQGRIG